MATLSGVKPSRCSGQKKIGASKYLHISLQSNTCIDMEARRDVFQAIADPTRREIINLIAQQPQNLNAISSNFEMSQPGHLLTY
jgi:hypothetical protein